MTTRKGVYARRRIVHRYSERQTRYAEEGGHLSKLNDAPVRNGPSATDLAFKRSFFLNRGEREYVA